jgi:hypothetical protein
MGWVVYPNRELQFRSRSIWSRDGRPDAASLLLPAPALWRKRPNSCGCRLQPRRGFPRLCAQSSQTQQEAQASEPITDFAHVALRCVTRNKGSYEDTLALDRCSRSSSCCRWASPTPSAFFALQYSNWICERERCRRNGVKERFPYAKRMVCSRLALQTKRVRHTKADLAGNWGTLGGLSGDIGSRARIRTAIL